MIERIAKVDFPNMLSKSFWKLHALERVPLFNVIRRLPISMELRKSSYCNKMWVLIDASWSMDRYAEKIDRYLELPGKKFVFRTDFEKLDEPLEFYGRSAVYDCFARFSAMLLKDYDPDTLVVITDGDDTGSIFSNQGTCRMHLRALEKEGWTVRFPVKNPFELERTCSYNIWSCSRR